MALRISLHKIRPSYILKPRGKNLKFVYYIRCALRNWVPQCWLKRHKTTLLNSLEHRTDKDYILDRVNYYNKLTSITPVTGTKSLTDIPNKGSTYNRDTFEIARYFDPSLKIDTLFGDNVQIGTTPSIVKSRPIQADNQFDVVLNLDKVRHFTFLKDKRSFASKLNQAIFRGATIVKSRPIQADNQFDVVLNLDKVRHFTFLKDKRSFASKLNQAIFRGATYQSHRQRFMNMYFGHPLVDCANTAHKSDLPSEWNKPLITLYDHLHYKFVICLEGNDVASNLKWVMSSNSIAIMPKPKYETWFMEGRLQAGVHYIEIKDDFSDLEEKIQYYSQHIDEAEVIIRNAHEFVHQFFDHTREELIAEIKDDFSDLEEKIQYYSQHIDEAEVIIRNAHEFVHQFFDHTREELIAILVMQKYFEMTGQVHRSK